MRRAVPYAASARIAAARALRARVPHSSRCVARRTLRAARGARGATAVALTRLGCAVADALC